MTDTHNTTKPLRKRCSNCKTSFFNDPIDIDAHNKFCPMIVAKKVKDLTEAKDSLEAANEDLLARLDALTDRLADLEEIETAAPAFDLDDVEEVTPDGALHDDDDEDSDDDAVVREMHPAFTDYPPAIDRDDDYDDDDDVDDLATPRPIA